MSGAMPNADIEVIRDEDTDEVTGFKGDPDDVPETLRDNPGALVTGPNDYRFATPIWGSADTFMEMEEAGILRLNPTQAVDFGDLKVFVYETDV